MLRVRSSRRAVVSSGLWAVPVVVAAAAAPAFAASSQTVTTNVTAACKTTGGLKVYTFTIEFCNQTTSTATLKVTGATVNGNVLASVQFTETGSTTATIAPNTCVTLHVTGTSPNASSNNAYVYYTATPGGDYFAFTDVVNNCA